MLLWTKEVDAATTRLLAGKTLLPSLKPKTRLEKAILKVPAIEKEMKSLCRKLARCNIGSGDVQLQQLFLTTLNEAFAAQRGSKASLWYQIDDGGESEPKLGEEMKQD